MVKPALPDSMIEVALQECCGAISGFEKLAEGLDSQTYGFRHGNAGYVGRINRSRRGFCKDAFVYHRFASPTLPIPEIIGITQLDEGQFHLYLAWGPRREGPRPHFVGIP